MHKLALVMFDLDGTLVATAGEIQDAVNDTLQQFGLPLVDEQQVQDWIGHGTRTLLAQAIAFASGRPAEVVRASDSFETLAAEFTRHYGRRCGTRSRLYPHVREVLGELRRRGVRLAVVTNKEQAFTRLVLEQHGLAPLLDAVLSGDTAPAKKPDPAGLLACMAALGAEPAECLFVGDSSIDVAAARAADVRVWAVGYGYNMGQPIAEAAPDRLLADLQPLLGLAAAHGFPEQAVAASVAAAPAGA
jgi:phosphoglycolate phosphatase